MKCLLLAVLVAVMQAPSPVPRKAADNPARAASGTQSQTTPNKAPTATPKAPVNANAPKKNEDAHSGIGTENIQKAVRIGELPPVTVTKDWTDRAYWVFSGVLVIVGGFQAWFLYGTLRAINRQADVMLRQTVATETAAIASKTSADALINAERAWVVAELYPSARQGVDRRWYHEDGIPFTTDEVLAGKHLLYRLRATNMGRTPAHILSFEIRYSCLPADVKDLPKNAGDVVEVGEFEVLLDGGKSIEITQPALDMSKYMNDSWDEICRLEKTAVFHGCVKYRHMFSTTEDCQSDYRYVYQPSLNRLTKLGRHTRYT